MNKSNLISGMIIAFGILSITCFFVNISTQMITVLSISSLLFTISQTIRSYLTILNNKKDEEFDTIKELCNFEINSLMTKCYKFLNRMISVSKKEKILKLSVKILEIVSVVILILGLIIPFDFFNSDNISKFCTIFSFEILFINIILVDKINKCIKEYQDMQMYSVLLKEMQKQEEDIKNDQAKTTNPQ